VGPEGKVGDALHLPNRASKGKNEDLTNRLRVALDHFGRPANIHVDIILI
jgi:hypothetical protein